MDALVKFSNRTCRIASEIRKCIISILRFKVRDPRVNGSIVIVSGIDLSKDLSCAKVYVTFSNAMYLIDNDQLNEKIKILRGASGFIRSVLAKDMSLRVVPELFFIYDDSIIESMRIYHLLTRLGI